MKAQPLIVVLSVLGLPPETRSEYLLQSESVCVCSEAIFTPLFQKQCILSHFTAILDLAPLLSIIVRTLHGF